MIEIELIRYKGRIMFINPPAVYVFCNKPPDENLLSKDRWKIR
jgi:hypothetical protein